MLVLMKPADDELMPKYRSMFSFVNQLKAGQGLTVVASVLPGSVLQRSNDAIELEQVENCC